MASRASRVVNFEGLKLIGQLTRATKSLGWKAPTPIQKRLVPLILKGKSVVASAPTGTGKTAAYALPLLHKAHEHRARARHEGVTEPSGVSRPRALVIVPVPELAKQVHDHLDSLLANFPSEHLRISTAVHGINLVAQEEALSLGEAADVLIATPRRLVELATSVSDEPEP